MAKIYKKDIYGRITEIRNWRELDSNSVTVGRLLSVNEELEYYRMKADGKSDSQIWRTFHPSQHQSGREHKPTATHSRTTPKGSSQSLEFELPVEALTKGQLIYLIQQKKSVNINALEKLDKLLIEKLFKALYFVDTVKIKLDDIALSESFSKKLLTQTPH